MQNKASAQDLESSLGRFKAEAEPIVKYREQNGNFKTWHDVAAVPGVSAAKIASAKAHDLIRDAVSQR
jgi:competence ComEA-like helix-hairpin-helix protein